MNRWFSAALLLLQLGCAGRAPPPVINLLPAPAQTRPNELLVAANAYYEAKTVEEMRSAIALAQQAGPDSAVYHELAANRAFLEARIDHAIGHLLEALRDPGNDAASLHLEILEDRSLTISDRSRVEAVLRSVSRHHPNKAVRAKAGYQLQRSLYHRSARRQFLVYPGQQIPFALIGAWDNEQGKAFDTELEPETEINFDAKYDGSLVEIGWRQNLPTAPVGPEYNLSAFFSPNRWSVAYAVSTIKINKADDYELRITSSVPFKVWLNGRLLFEERHIDEERFDQFILPISLVRGAHRVLIKSAQETGGWVLSARLTGPKGDHLPGLVSFVPGDALHLQNHQPKKRWTSKELVQRRVATLQEGARRKYHRVTWARMMGLEDLSVQLGDTFVAEHASSVAGRLLLSTVLWDHKEQGKASDLLAELDALAGEKLPYIRMQYARLLRQDGLMRKARKALLAARDSHPDRGEIWYRLARQFKADGWVEDRCNALEEAERLRRGWLAALRQLADCKMKLGYRYKAIGIHQQILRSFPNEYASLSFLAKAEQQRGRWWQATQHARKLTRTWGHLTFPWLRLAELRRRANDRWGAEQALHRVLELNPDSARAYREQGNVAYQHGDRKAAIEHWQASLTRNPEDERLANRLSFLTPEARDPWEHEVPSDEILEEVVASREQVKPLPGADVIELMDHMVTRINPDGSTTEFVTRVVHAVNEAGRDRLTKMRMGRGGRTRVLNAYAVDPKGRRVQVSSLRNRVARFRGLAVGSTVVLQYRHDQRPVGYLARHVARGWWFQGSSAQRALSQWIIWAPAGTKYHEWINGQGVKKEESKEGEHIRLSYTAHNIAPIISEPRMPTGRETSLNMLFSTVPSWEAFLEWEKALLSEAFRESAEVKALAQELFKGLTEPQDKVLAIHRYLMEEIRYQMDYENHIAGVKPHPSTVVLKRKYGDCKDKAVLFIALARLANIDVHFTLLRTRTAGPLLREVPMQQFNHAIVYVPKQPGIAEARFYDPTADALDVLSLRSDDSGTESLVLDTKTMKSVWIPIPYQSMEHNGSEIRTHFVVEADGKAKGTMELTARGREGAWIRKLARNEKKFQQGMQLLVGRQFAGGTMNEAESKEVQDLSKPAKIALDITSPSHGRIEGKELRLRSPQIWSPETYFRLSTRKYPLLFGVPKRHSWHSTLEIPAKAKVSRLPRSTTIAAPCFELKQQASSKGRTITIDQTLLSKCERIEVGAYAEHRAKAEEVIRLFQEEIVIDVSRVK